MVNAVYIPLPVAFRWDGAVFVPVRTRRIRAVPRVLIPSRCRRSASGPTTSPEAREAERSACPETRARRQAGWKDDDVIEMTIGFFRALTSRFLDALLRVAKRWAAPGAGPKAMSG